MATDVIQTIKEEINLQEYLVTYESHSFIGDKTLCPFHDDHNPSMDVQFRDGRWLFFCHACGAGGDIITYLEKKHGKSFGEIIGELKEKFNIKDFSAKKTEYIYKDIEGNEIFKKVKIKKDDRTKDFIFYHKENNEWVKGNGNIDPIPYNLDRFADSDKLIICEGESDADNINRLNTAYLATSAPFGMNSWPDDITDYFKDISSVIFLYDVGAEKNVQKHANRLKTKIPNLEIYIASIPMKNKQDDISDYLDKFPDSETKKTKLIEVLNTSAEFKIGNELEERGKDLIFVGTLEDFMFKDIPEVEVLINPYVFRGGLTEVGGVKGSHKSFFVTNMALHYTSGKSPFLSGIIEKSGKVLLIQQEISMGFMKKRLERMRMAKVFDTGERFYPVTTTARQLKLLCEKDYDQIKKWVETYEPDILILDPLSTFNTSEENMSKDMSKIINRLSEIKAMYNLGLVVTHHFSSKRNPNDPAAPVEAGAWFRGHTILSDAADALICLHRLPGQRENPNLPKPYEDYNLVEVALRNGRWPEKIAIEFDEDTFMLEESSIWSDIGKKIIPGEIVELIDVSGGKMLQTEVIGYFRDRGTGITTIKKAIKEAVNQQKIFKEVLKGKGNPVLLKTIV